MKFITSLSDAGQPYSCEAWQSNFGSSDAPLVLDENQSSTGFFSMLHDSWNAFPTFAILDHTMTVRAKPWTLDSNSNSNNCDGSNNTINGWSGGDTNDFLQQLVSECGVLCEPCSGTVDMGDFDVVGGLIVVLFEIVVDPDFDVEGVRSVVLIVVVVTVWVTVVAVVNVVVEVVELSPMKSS